MSSIYDDYAYPSSIEAGDVIDPDWGNEVVNALKGLLGYTHVESYPQPIQVGKHSILVLLVEGTASIGFPQSVHVYLSPDDITYEEVGAVDLPLDGFTHDATVTVPIPKGYFVYWDAPYGFVKSAVMF